MPGEWRPYFLIGYRNLTANQSAGIDLDVGANEEFEGRELRILSTSTFDIVGIKNESGLPFTNADQNTVLDNLLLRILAEGSPEPVQLDPPLQVPPTGTISVTVTDTSASGNEIWILLVGKIRTA